MVGRTFVLLCSVVAILLFSGCGKKNEVYVLQQFKSEVTITDSDMQYKGTVDFDGDGQLNFTITYPETLKGIKLTCTADGVKYNFHDAQFKIISNGHIFRLWNILNDMKTRTLYIGDTNVISDSNFFYKITFNQEKKFLSLLETSDCIYSFYQL